MMVPVNGAELLFAFSLRTKPRAIASLSPLSHLSCTRIELVKWMSLRWLMGPVRIYSSENINCTGLEESVHCPKAPVPSAFASKYGRFLSYRSKMNRDSW